MEELQPGQKALLLSFTEDGLPYVVTVVQKEPMLAFNGYHWKVLFPAGTTYLAYGDELIPIALGASANQVSALQHLCKITRK